MDHYRMYIDGAWCDAVAGGTREAVNPATEEIFATVAWGTRADAQAAIEAANRAAKDWAQVPLWERSKLCKKMAAALEAKCDELADVLCTELGKPFEREALSEAKLTPGNFYNAAEQAKWLEGSTIPVQNPRKRVMSFRRPHGVVGIITPWNFPAAIPGHYLPYALMMGNTTVWTPAPTAAVTSVKVMEALAEAGLPPGVVNLVIGPGPEVGDEIVVNPGTHAIGLTGSTQTGRAVAGRCGLKPRLMELGGNGPTIILPDADPVQAAQAVSSSCFFAAGQICSSAERILVADPLKEEFVGAMIEESQKWIFGDPRDPETRMGPQNSPAVLEKMAAHLKDAREKGATVVAGGRRPDRPGYFHEPTVLVDFTPDSLVNREETFGPIAPVAGFADEEEAWKYISACDLGLVSSVFTRDVTKAWKWAESLRTGMVVVNDRSTYWELHIPTGGRSGGDSGVGRLGGRHTLEFMSDLQTIAFHVP